LRTSESDVEHKKQATELKINYVFLNTCCPSRLTTAPLRHVLPLKRRFVEGHCRKENGGRSATESGKNEGLIDKSQC
jgi:hypothetical protein